MNLVCPICGGSIQATRKEDWDISADGEAARSYPGTSPDWDVYCSSDCPEMACSFTATLDSELADLVQEHIDELNNEPAEP